MRLALAPIWLQLALTVPAQAPALDDPAVQAQGDYLRQQTRVLFILSGWGNASMIGAGLGFLAVRTPFAAAFELQALAWGLVDEGIAIYGLRQTKREGANGAPIAHWMAQRHQSRETFWLNAGLDLLYLAVGGLLWRLGRSPRWRGAGAGVVLQGGVLLVFDVLAGWGMGA